MAELKHIDATQISKIAGDKYVVTAEELAVIVQYAQKFDSLGLFQVSQKINNRGIISVPDQDKPTFTPQDPEIMR